MIDGDILARPRPAHAQWRSRRAGGSGTLIFHWRVWSIAVQVLGEHSLS